MDAVLEKLLCAPARPGSPLLAETVASARFRATFDERGVGDTMTGRGAAL